MSENVISPPVSLVVEWADEAHSHLLNADPPMAALAQRQGPMQRELNRNYFERLVRAITGQQISGKAAASIFRRVAERCETGLTPEALQSLTDEELRGCGLSLNKLLSVRDLSLRALDGRLDLSHLETLPDEEVRTQLVDVRGIGRWTADMFLMFSLGRPDVLPAEDLGIRNAIRRMYGMDITSTPTAIRKRALESGWHPYATAASFYLWKSLEEPEEAVGWWNVMDPAQPVTPPAGE